MNGKLIILGCGYSLGVPRIDGFWGKCNKNNKKNLRSRCSAVIKKGTNNILIDTSPDIRNQLNNNKIQSISSVIYTHEHSDQTNGLFELRPFYWKNKKPIDIYGNRKTIKSLKERFSFCFENKKNYPAIVKSHIVKKKFSLGSSKSKIKFSSINVKHGVTNSIIYIFEKLAYLSDCNDLSIINFMSLKNLNCLVIDCLKIDNNFAHFTLEQCLFINEMLKPKKMVLTNLHTDLDYDFLLRILPKNVLPAYDGLKINL